MRTPFRNDQLPKEFSVLLGEAHQHAAVSFVTWIAWQAVVGADEDLALGDRRGWSMIACPRERTI